MVRRREEAKGLSATGRSQQDWRHQDGDLAILACPGPLHRSLRPCLTGIQRGFPAGVNPAFRA